MRAAFEADRVRRQHDVATARQLQGVRLLRIAGQPGDLALAQVELPRVLVVRTPRGQALTRPHVSRQEEVGGHAFAGLDRVADPLAHDVTEVHPFLDQRLQRRRLGPATHELRHPLRECAQLAHQRSPCSTSRGRRRGKAWPAISSIKKDRRREGLVPGGAEPAGSSTRRAGIPAALRVAGVVYVADLGGVGRPPGRRLHVLDHPDPPVVVDGDDHRQAQLGQE